MPDPDPNRLRSPLIAIALALLLAAVGGPQGSALGAEPAMVMPSGGPSVLLDGELDHKLYLPLVVNPPELPPELLNGEFEEGTWRETFDGRVYVEIDVPQDWVAFWKEGADVPHDPSNSLGYVRPEMKVINSVDPYLDPPRILSGNRALQYFKQWAIYDAGLYQTIPGVRPGDMLRLSGWAHAWSANGTYDDASCSEGEDVGCEAFYALEGTEGLDDAERNFTFRVGIDPTGGTDPWAASVVWGEGAHIYNVYAAVPTVEVAAQSTTATVFVRSDVLWGFRNCDSYWDDITLEVLRE